MLVMGRSTAVFRPITGARGAGAVSEAQVRMRWGRTECVCVAEVVVVVVVVAVVVVVLWWWW